MNCRYGKPVNGQLQLRSRPEDFIAPYFLDTGKFAAGQRQHSLGYETYFRKKSLLLGSEYYCMNSYSKSAGITCFMEATVVATWCITGETRPYNTVGGYFKDVEP